MELHNVRILTPHQYWKVQVRIAFLDFDHSKKNKKNSNIVFQDPLYYEEAKTQSVCSLVELKPI